MRALIVVLLLLGVAGGTMAPLFAGGRRLVAILGAAVAISCVLVLAGLGSD